MRSVSRFLKITAGALALLLLVAIAGWLSRHSWLPGVLNRQLDGLSVTEFHGLNLSRTDQGLSAQIDHLRLVTPDQLSLDLNGIHVSSVPALIRTLLSAATQAPPQSEISVERLELASAEEPTVDITGNAEPEAEPGVTTSPPMSRTDVSAQKTETATGVSIGDLLNSLKNLPIRKLQIQHIFWPNTINGELSLSVTQTPRHTFEGELRSDRCRSCRLELSAQSEASQVKVALRLHHADKTVGMLDTWLRPLKPAEDGNPTDNWRFEGRLNLAADQLPPLMQKVGISSRTPGDWFEIAQSLSGTFALTLNGEIPDRFTGTDDLRDITAAVETRALALVLPEGYAGLPLATEITTAQPVNLHIRSFTPFSVASIEGELRLRTDIQSTVQVPTVSPPLLLSNFELSTEDNIPRVLFRGQTRLNEASRLWKAQKWQLLRSQLPVTDMQGTQTFSGAFSLPGLDGILSKSEALEIGEFLAEIRLEDDAIFQLELPKNDNPLAAIKWQKLRVIFSGGEPIKISAPKFPGAVDLAFPQLSFAVNEISKPTSGKSEAPELQGELGNFRCSSLPGINCTLQLKALIPKLSLSDANSGVSNLNLTVAEAHITSLPNGPVSVALRELNISAEQALSDDITVGKPEIFAQQVECQWQNGALSCKSPQLAANLDPLSSGDNQVRAVVFLEEFSVIHSSDKPQDFQAAARFHADTMEIHALKQFKAGIAASGQWQLRGQQITGSSEITAGPLALTTTWQHNLDNAQGALTIALPQTEFAPSNPLSRAVSGLPADIVGGKLQAKASFQWPGSDGNRLQIAFSDTALQYNNSFAVGINTQIALQQNDGNWVTAKPAPVSVDSVDAGVAVTNLNFVLSLAGNGDLTLGNFSAELLEGALTADNLYWNLDGEERHSRLQFTGLSIGALAQEMESTNFAASGLLDASIPITTDRQGVTVDNGTVQSRPPGGRLRYYGAFSPGMLGSNPQLKLLAGALEDYNYQDISGTMSYPLSGDMKLNLKLTGRSAAIDANRDLIINLNLENNVPSMLRSLQASRDVTDVLERQVP